jgi:hypothetical protein
MKFLFPSFLYALFVIAVPVIIHLFNFRKYKKVFFTNVRFLKEIKQQTQSKSQLKHLLVLLSRILAVSFLVFAFAQPYIPAEQKTQITSGKAVSIYIDNSFSMEGINEKGSLFEQSKQYAREILNAYAATDIFQVLTNDFEGRHQHLVNKEDFIDLTDEIEISANRKSLSEIISRQKEIINKQDGFKKDIFIISDFQKNNCDFENVKPDSNISIYILPVQATTIANVYIDSCWFSSPVRTLNQTEKLNVRLINKSENNYENLPIKLSINGQQKSIASFSVEPNGITDTALYFTSTQAGIQQLHVSITDYPVTFDDNYYLSYTIAEKINILSIYQNDSSTHLHSLFKNDSLFSIKQVKENSIDYSSFPKTDLIVLVNLDKVSSGLTQEISKFVNNGGSLLVFPGTKIDIELYAEFTSTIKAGYFEKADSSKTKVSKINYRHIIYNGVFEKEPESIDLPVVFKYYTLKVESKNINENLLVMENDKPLLTAFNNYKGDVYLCTSPLSPQAGNFPQHAIFVPTIYNIAVTSRKSINLSYFLDNNSAIEIPNKKTDNTDVIKLSKSGSEFEIIPETYYIQNKIRLHLHNQVKEAGNYLLTQNNSVLEPVSFNYSRKESQPDVFTEKEITELAGNYGINVKMLDSGNFIAEKLNEITEGKKLWKYCILLVLLFLLAETLLLRFWK